MAGPGVGVGVDSVETGTDPSVGFGTRLAGPGETTATLVGDTVGAPGTTVLEAGDTDDEASESLELDGDPPPPHAVSNADIARQSAMVQKRK